MNRKAIYIGRSKTEPGKYHVEIISQNRVERRKEYYPSFGGHKSTKTYIVTQERLGKILNIVGHTNFYFDCDGGEINLFGEYEGRKA